MFKDIQEEVNKLEDYINTYSRSKNDDVFVLMTHLIAECGEAADEIKGLEGKRAEDPSDYSKDELAKELVDIIFNVLRIARKYNIDMDKYFQPRIDKIYKKFSID
jgi:NTP pyrophosphatase (non-canonical NTP hydrolase)